MKMNDLDILNLIFEPDKTRTEKIARILGQGFSFFILCPSIAGFLLSLVLPYDFIHSAMLSLAILFLLNCDFKN
jgi:hypothetical protein